MITDDLRKRLRPRDPNALLICTKCNKIKSTAFFGYQEGSGRYRTECKPCRTLRNGQYVYKKTTSEPEYYDKLLAMNRQSHAKTAKQNKHYRRLVQSRISFLLHDLKDLKTRKVLLKDLAAEIGISPRHLSKFVHNKAGRTPWDTLERVENAVRRWHDYYVKEGKS